LIKAITFDFWNTLYLTPPNRTLHDIRINGVTRVLQNAGYELSQEEVSEVFLQVWAHVYREQRAYGREFSPPQQLRQILQRMNVNISSSIWEEAYYYYSGTLLEYPPRINTDVIETLPRLKERYKLAVICNTGISPGSVLRKLMERDGIIGCFEHLTFSDEVDCAKPNRRIFEYTLEKLGVPGIEAAHIGDDKLTDIVGAKMAGMTAVWLAPGQNWKVPEADYHLQTVKELLDLW